MSIESLKGMKPLQTRPTAEQQDKKLHEVSAMYEKQFLREMLKAMRGTIQESGLIKTNQAEKIFKEQLDGEYVDKWSEKGGIGLADMIHKQLIEKYGPQLGITKQIAKPHGPIALNEKNNFTGSALVPLAESGKKVTYRIDRTPAPSDASVNLKTPGLGGGMGDNALKSPWDGILIDSKKLGSDEHLMQIEHANGLKSSFVFRGLPSAGPVGQNVEAGQTVGFLSPEAKAFFWSFEKSPENRVESQKNGLKSGSE